MPLEPGPACAHTQTVWVGCTERHASAARGVSRTARPCGSSPALTTGVVVAGAVWQRTPVKVTSGLAGRHVVDCACGRDHTVAVTDEGLVFAWGRGEHGQLFGTSRRPFTSPPTASTVLSRGHATRVAAHNNCTCAMSASGRMECIGECFDRERTRCASILGAVLGTGVSVR